MGLFNRFRQWQFSKHRLEAYSDAVFAIVLTLLVLELRMPHITGKEDTAAIWQALKSVAPVFLSWLISFFFVSIIWLHHHQIMLMATRSDYGVIWINTFLLFFICLLPFPTALLGEYPMQPLTVMLWGLTVSATTTVLVWLYHYNTRHYLAPGFNPASVKKNVRRSLLAGPLLYFLAGMMAWVSVYISFAVYLLVPLLYILPLDLQNSEAGSSGLS